MITNPWVHLNQEYPILLPSDYQAVMSFNSAVNDIHKIHWEVLPEPYLGKPDTPFFCSI
jgi:hypothetical protein